MLSAEQYAKNLGAVIRRRRLEADIASSVLAEAIGLNEKEWAEVESGESLLGTQRLILVAQKLLTYPGSLFFEAETIHLPDEMKKPILQTLFVGDSVLRTLQTIEEVLGKDKKPASK